MAQADAVPGQTGWNRRGTCGGLTGTRLPDHGETPQTHEFRTI
jgi:hypothetical protein